MKRFLPCFLLLCLAFQVHGQKFFFDKADEFFNRYVSNGKVKYQSIKADPHRLSVLDRKIAKMNLNNASDQVKKAFYINAYNLLSIKSVIDHYPVESPTHVDGFFDKIKHKVAGEKLTLDQLEKQKLYQNWSDPRLHFALVCAAKGCPPLKEGAYYPNSLNEQLDQQAERALKDKNFIRVDYEGRKVKVSQIFNWYHDHFTTNASSILDYINQKRNDPLPSDTRISFYEYDWSLNELSSK